MLAILSWADFGYMTRCYYLWAFDRLSFVDDEKKAKLTQCDMSLA